MTTVRLSTGVLAICCLQLLPVMVATGCGRGGSSPGSRHSQAGDPPDFERQVAAVRDGRAMQITAWRPPSDGEWESLRGMAGLRELTLKRGKASDEEAEILATLPDVERLVLRESPLSDSGFAIIARCRKLRDLNVPQAACTAAGLRALASLPNLRSLRLGGGNLMGREVCEAIATLSSLESLHLIDVAIGDEGLRVLAGMPRLWNLYLDDAVVSDEAWEAFFQKRPDVHVHVDQAHHDRDPKREHEVGSTHGK